MSTPTLPDRRSDDRPRFDVRRLLKERPLIARDVDGHSLRRDLGVLAASLVIALGLVGGGVWLGLHLVDRAQHKAPAKTKAAAPAAKAKTAASRHLELSKSGVPVDPQVGQAIVLPVRADDTSGVGQTLLYDGNQIVSRQAGMATSVTWTPKTTGTHQLKLVLELDNGQQAVSAALPIQVGESHPGTANVSGDVLNLAQKLVDAVNAKNWDLVRQIDPTKSGWSDNSLADDYADLVDDTLVPVSTTPRSDSTIRLHAGLVAHEHSRTRLYCISWDVDVGQGEVRQSSGRQLYPQQPASTPVAQVEQRLIDSCGSG